MKAFEQNGKESARAAQQRALLSSRFVRARTRQRKEIAPRGPCTNRVVEKADDGERNGKRNKRRRLQLVVLVPTGEESGAGDQPEEETPLTMQRRPGDAGRLVVQWRHEEGGKESDGEIADNGGTADPGVRRGLRRPKVRTSELFFDRENDVKGKGDGGGGGELQEKVNPQIATVFHRGNGVGRKEKKCGEKADRMPLEERWVRRKRQHCGDGGGGRNEKRAKCF